MRDPRPGERTESQAIGGGCERGERRADEREQHRLPERATDATDIPHPHAPDGEPARERDQRNTQRQGPPRRPGSASATIRQAPSRARRREAGAAPEPTRAKRRFAAQPSVDREQDRAAQHEDPAHGVRRRAPTCHTRTGTGSTIAVVNVSNPIIAYRPYSPSRCSPTSSPRRRRKPCAIAGSTVRRNTRPGETPSDAALSSSAGVEPTQLRGQRQVQERVVGERRDEHRGAEAVQARRQRDPRVALHEGRDRERRDRQPGPDTGTREVAALRQPGERPAPSRAASGIVQSSSRSVSSSSDRTRARKTSAARSVHPVATAVETMNASGQQRRRGHDSRRPECRGVRMKRGEPRPAWKTSLEPAPNRETPGRHPEEAARRPVSKHALPLCVLRDAPDGAPQHGDGGRGSRSGLPVREGRLPS